MATQIITGYTGQKHITPNMDAKVFKGIFGKYDYILEEGSNVTGSMLDANNFILGDGVVSMQGRQIQVMQETLTIATCASGSQRNDLVCIRYSHDSETGIDSAQAVVVQGTTVTNGAPQDPEINNGTIESGATPVDMALYRVSLDGDSYDVTQLATDSLTQLSDLTVTQEVIDALEAIGITVSGGGS